MKKNLLLLISCLLIINMFNANSAEYTITNYDITSTSGGLINNSVNAISQDNNGNMWFGYSGNASGLTKYDGTNWTTYTISDGMINDNVTDIAVHSDGTVWIATSGGVSSFDGITFTNYTVSDGLIDNYVSDVEIDYNGHIWFGTGIGISVFDGTTGWTSITDYNLSQSVYISAMSADSNGKIWISTMDGVAFWNSSVWTGHLQDSTTDLVPNVYNITENTDGSVWFSSYDYMNGGISMLSTTGTWTKYITADTINLGELYGMDSDGFGNIWVGQFMLGLWSFDGSIWTLFSTTNGLISNDLSNTVFVDGQNNVWAATMNGISKLTPTMIVYPFSENYASCGGCDGTLSVSIMGGTAPYVYSLMDGATQVSQGTLSDYDSIPNLCAGTYVLNVTDASGLLTWQDTVYLETAPTSISGSALLNGDMLMELVAYAELYKSNPGGVNHTLIERQLISLSGYYSFYNIEADLYVIKIAKDTTDYMYPNIISTYYNGVVGSGQATVIDLSCGQELYNTDIEMYEATPMPAGNISISGTINYAAYFKATGDPVPGAEVYIEQEPNDDPVAQVVSDSSGNYNIDGLYDSIYTISIDIPGLNMTSTYENINLNDPDSIFTDLDFYVDTINGLGISTDSTMNIVSFEKPEFKISVYPNPFSELINIEYSANEPGTISIDILDVTGKLIDVIVNEKQDYGDYKYEYTGQKSGVYFIRFRLNNHVYLKRIIQTK